MGASLPLSPPPDFTVVIPTYNGGQRLPIVLQHLQQCWDYGQRQAVPPTWEVIVVDNRSNDNTAEVVAHYQAQWGPQPPLHYAWEPKPGAAHARQRGVSLARSELVGFLDDDNWPEPDWIVAAIAFAQGYPQAGAFGSQIHAAFEQPPDPALEAILPFLAIVERGEQPLRYEPAQKLLPPSAGLVVRRSVWLTCLPDRPRLSGRTATSMLTAEDLESLLYIQRQGWEIWYSPSLTIHHQMPAWRLQRSYLIPFFKGIGLSRHITRMLSVKAWQRPVWFLLYLLNDVQRLGRLGLARWRLGWAGASRKPELGPKKLVLDCKITLFWYSFLSPWYIWRGRL